MYGVSELIVENTVDYCRYYSMVLYVVVLW